MASMIQKQLVEFLKEQQEPFVLEAYLLERGCCYHSQKNRFHSSDVSSCYCSSTMAKPSCLKRSFGWGLKRNQKFLPNCSKVVRALFTKLVTLHNNQKHGNHQKKIRHQNTCAAALIDKGRHEIADEDNFSSSASSTTTVVFNSCPESDAEHAHCSPPGNSDIFLAADHQESSEVVYVLTENEVVAGWKFRRRNGEEDSKQLSPVSVLEETESYSGSPVEGEFTIKQKGELNLKKSASRCIEEKEKPIHKRKTLEEVEDFVGYNSNSNSDNNVSSQYSKNKKAVQQTKQLLFDCIREVVELEKHKKKKRESSEGQQQSKGILGSEQLWELICENLSSWSKESINETNIIHLLHSEVLLVSSAQEWKWGSDIEKQTQEIGSQLGGAILEDICNEIILEMIIFCTDK